MKRLKKGRHCFGDPFFVPVFYAHRPLNKIRNGVLKKGDALALFRGCGNGKRMGCGVLRSFSTYSFYAIVILPFILDRVNVWPLNDYHL
jgi:hypothetical protein